MNAIGRLIAHDRETPRRVLVLGDGMTDVYVSGRLDARCQEGCTKFVQDSEVSVVGGAANAARCLENWNAQVRFYYRSPTNGPYKARFMVDDVCVFRWDDEQQGALLFDRIRDEAFRTLDEWRPDAVLLSDYDKGLLTPEFIRAVVGHCARVGVPCVADAKRAPDVYDGAILKGNWDWDERYPQATEAYRYVRTNGATTPDVWEKGWLQDLPELPPVRCVNYVGAGDCFAAHLTLAFAYGFSLKDAAAMAHSAGRVYVQRRHNHPPTPEEVRADMEGHGWTFSAG